MSMIYGFPVEDGAMEETIAMVSERVKERVHAAIDSIYYRMLDDVHSEFKRFAMDFEEAGINITADLESEAENLTVAAMHDALDSFELGMY